MIETGIKSVVIQEIEDIAKKYGVEKVILFGSRARGDFHKTSDIDLAICGGDKSRFKLDVEDETSTLLTFDVIDFDENIHQKLRDSINQEGIIIYEKI